MNVAAKDAVVLTPDDDVQISTSNGLLILDGGDVTVRMISGNDCTFPSIPAGSYLNINIDILYATGTTATLFVGLN